MRVPKHSTKHSTKTFGSDPLPRPSCVRGRSFIFLMKGVEVKDALFGERSTVGQVFYTRVAVALIEA